MVLLVFKESLVLPVFNIKWCPNLWDEILVVAVIMTTAITYCSKMLRNIGSTARLVTNYALFGLETIVRSKIIDLGIKRRRNLRPYRCSRGGRFVHLCLINLIVNIYTSI